MIQIKTSEIVNQILDEFKKIKKIEKIDDDKIESIMRAHHRKKFLLLDSDTQHTWLGGVSEMGSREGAGGHLEAAIFIKIRKKFE